MDIAAISMSESLSSLQNAASILTLDKAMGQDAQAMASIVQTMQECNPPVAPGGLGYFMDVRA